MPARRLFCPTIAKGTVVLSADESNHAIAALRIRPGERVILFDGSGVQGFGEVARIRPRQLHVEVTRVTRHPFELLRRVTLAVAPPKTHRQGYLVEKCTELGVAAIWPIRTQREVAKPRAAAIDRWARRAIEAAKQSGRTWVPFIAPPQTFQESLERIAEFDVAVLTDLDPAAAPLTSLLRRQPESKELLVWVGPEGGWSDEERSQAIEAGAVPAKLGPNVLRTETAAVAVCAATALLHYGACPRGD